MEVMTRELHRDSNLSPSPTVPTVFVLIPTYPTIPVPISTPFSAHLFSSPPMGARRGRALSPPPLEMLKSVFCCRCCLKPQ